MMRTVARTPTRPGSRSSIATSFTIGCGGVPASGLAMATNSRAFAAGDTWKFVISRSCTSPPPAVTRSATPRMSFCDVGLVGAAALEKRTVVASTAPGWKQPCRSGAGRSSATRSSAFRTPSTALAWKARSAAVAPLRRRLRSWTLMRSRASPSKIGSSASGHPPSYVSYLIGFLTALTTCLAATYVRGRCRAR